MADKSHRILIVDDDVDILANLSDILTVNGYETVTACSGPNALDKIDSNSPNGQPRFDLCLLDFRMPGMDGVELLKRIQFKQPAIRAIMMTAYAGEDGSQRALDAGSLKVMNKPVDIDVLLGIIDDVVA